MKSASLTNVLLLVIAVACVGNFFQGQATKNPGHADSGATAAVLSGYLEGQAERKAQEQAQANWEREMALKEKQLADLERRVAAVNRSQSYGPPAQSSGPVLVTVVGWMPSFIPDSQAVPVRVVGGSPLSLPSPTVGLPGGSIDSGSRIDLLCDQIIGCPADKREQLLQALVAAGEITAEQASGIRDLFAQVANGVPVQKREGIAGSISNP